MTPPPPLKASIGRNHDSPIITSDFFNTIDPERRLAIRGARKEQKAGESTVLSRINAEGEWNGWLLQTPEGGSPKLLENIIAECGPALRGGAAFAFASAAGVKLLTAEKPFQKFLKDSKFAVVVGLDAITDTMTVEGLKNVKGRYPNFKPKLFLHDTAGSCFHPKTIWFRSTKGGATITGSGNLTMGGLQSNWEALAVQTLTPNEIDQVEEEWNTWIATHKKQLLDLDDERALERAKANQTQRVRVRKALNLPEDEGAEAEALADIAEEVAEEALQDLKLNPILIAEVPKSKDRWEQVNFDKASFVQFFGVIEARRRQSNSFIFKMMDL